jgi:thioesterase domain-containing protein
MSSEAQAEIASRKEEILTLLRCLEGLEGGPRAIVPLRAEGDRPPLFGVPGHNGDVFCYVPLARHLDAGQPLLGVQPPGLDGEAPLRSLEALAAFEVEQIRRYRPQGPYLLAGYCAGGTIAFEIARQLTAQGAHVALLALIASPFPTTYRVTHQATQLLMHLRRRVPVHLSEMTAGSATAGVRYLRSRVGRLRGRWPGMPEEFHSRLVDHRRAVERATIHAIRHYRPQPHAGAIDLFLASEAWRTAGGRPDLWRSVTDAAREHVGPDDCPADATLLEPYVRTIAETLRRRLHEIRL